MKKILLALLFLATTNYATAAAVTSPITKISKVYTYGTYTVLAIQNSVAGSGCSKGNFVAFDITTNAGKALYSSALTAFTTGMQVRFGSNGCVSWGGTIPKVYRLEMIK